MSTPLVVGTGPLLVDQFVHCDELPEGDDLPIPGGKLEAENGEHMAGIRKHWVEGWRVETQVGGPVVALRQAKCLGANVRFVGAIGDDDLGSVITADLKRHGIDTSLLVHQPGRRSGSGIAWIDRHGGRSVLFDTGTLDPITGDETKVLLESNPDAVHTYTREHEAALALATAAHDRGIYVHHDIDPWAGWTPQQLAVSKVAQLSLDEAHATSPYEEGSEDEIGRSLQKEFDMDLVIITAGGEGVFAVDRNGIEHHVPALAVEAVDSVGAGDVFAGAFEVASATGSSTLDALRIASVAAAVHTTRLGNWKLATTEEVTRILR